MTRFSFITQIPDEPGALHRAAEIMTRYGGNINRIHYDRRIDPPTVFFEVTSIDENYQQLRAELERIGYLQTSLKPGGFLRFAIFLPHQSGLSLNFYSIPPQHGRTSPSWTSMIPEDIRIAWW